MAVAAFAVFLPAAGLFVFWFDGGLVGAWLAYDALMIGRFVTLFRRYRTDAWLVSFAR
jgi:Na+-driven multidrug efflux pump